MAENEISTDSSKEGDKKKIWTCKTETECVIFYFFVILILWGKNILKWRGGGDVNDTKIKLIKIKKFVYNY